VHIKDRSRGPGRRHEAAPVPNDARRLGTRFAVPFFLLQGETDVMTLTSLAQEYFTDIQAPVQDLALIPDAGHLAACYQPEAFLAAPLTRGAPPRRNPRRIGQR
jgi:pimeloyl-ACP methyl ester carboxylesterase